MTKIIRYFIQGVIITVPVGVTVIIVYKVIHWVGSLFTVFGTIVSPIVDPFIDLIEIVSTGQGKYTQNIKENSKSSLRSTTSTNKTQWVSADAEVQINPIKTLSALAGKGKRCRH